jgi:hypothetical protein
MSLYELDAEDFVKVLVKALDPEIAANFEAAYRGDQGRENAAVARFVDSLLCEAQERIGDSEICTSGSYWAEARAEAQNLHHTDCDVYQSSLAGEPFGEYGCSCGCAADIAAGADLSDYHVVTDES